jgi:hypothetical protein
LESDGDDPTNRLICAAVVLARAIRRQAEVRDSLEELSIEPALLETDGIDELMREMSAVAGKLFADSRYNEAFELSEVKTRNLAALAAATARGRRAAAGGVDGDDKSERSSRRFRFGIDISPRVLAMILGPIVGIAITALHLSPLGGDVRFISPDQLNEISPFIESGHRQEHEGDLRFVGNLGPAWNYLPTAERRAATTEIGQHFAERGIRHVILLGPGPRLMARWVDGSVTELVEKPARSR